uniref:hypothetical protein n=1 Tax=Pseudomonas yangonensis TaxID=2579922 RepID=UPI00137A5C01
GINDNGGALTKTAASTNGYVKTELLTFNINVVYSQIKAQVNNQTEYNIWAEFVNKTLTGLDATCLGLNPAQWAVLTFKQRFAAVMNMF